MPPQRQGNRVVAQTTETITITTEWYVIVPIIDSTVYWVTSSTPILGEPPALRATGGSIKRWEMLYVWDRCVKNGKAYLRVVKAYGKNKVIYGWIEETKISVAQDPTISYGPRANQGAVTAKTSDTLLDLLRASRNRSAGVASTARTPADQARAMYQNLSRPGGVAVQRGLYLPPGNLVIDVYVARAAAGDTPQQIQAAMEAEIIRVGPTSVSNHCADPNVLGVIDVGIDTITNRADFVDEVVAPVTLINEPFNGCYHIEVPQ